jgi:hypothetical protein
MKIKLSIDSYKGVDGSSLSLTRCSQMIQVYEMLEQMGPVKTSYIDIQEEAERKNLFGKTKAKSAIRTFFPLLKKIDFVNYDDTFVANKCFTELGTQFVLACRALKNVTNETPYKDEIIARLQNIKRNAQCKGLVNMFNKPECKSHNIWIVLKLFKELRIIHWNEYLYTLSCLEKGKTIDEAIVEIRENKGKIDAIEFMNEDDEALPNTCYSYLRSFLEEAGLICKVSSLESKLVDEANIFYSQISL